MYETRYLLHIKLLTYFNFTCVTSISSILPMVCNKLASFYIQKQIKASIGTEMQWMSMTKKIVVSAYWMCILPNVQNSQAGMNIVCYDIDFVSLSLQHYSFRILSVLQNMYVAQKKTQLILQQNQLFLYFGYPSWTI